MTRHRPFFSLVKGEIANFPRESLFSYVGKVGLGDLNLCTVLQIHQA